MKFIQGTIRIDTKFLESAKDSAAQTVCNWADKNEVGVIFGHSESGEYLCQYNKRGRTQAFCKGTAAELKDLVKTIFNAKITTLFEAW